LFQNFYSLVFLRSTWPSAFQCLQGSSAIYWLGLILDTNHNVLIHQFLFGNRADTEITDNHLCVWKIYFKQNIMWFLTVLQKINLSHTHKYRNSKKIPIRKMFITLVLWGPYTIGQADFAHPTSKNICKIIPNYKILHIYALLPFQQT